MWLLCCALASAAVVDRVIAIVGDDPVLASEVALEIELAEVDPGPTPLWTSGRPPERIAVEAALMRGVAGEVDVYAPDAAAVAARARAIQDALGAGWDAFLTRHGVDAARVELEVRRRMTVERFLQRAISTDPLERELWLSSYDTLVDRLRGRVRVRVIPPQEGP